MKRGIMIIHPCNNKYLFSWLSFCFYNSLKRITFAAMFKKSVIYILTISLLILSGCSKYQKLLKSSDTELKYEMALKYYNETDYFRALQLLDELVILTRGTQKAETVYYHYAQCYYKQEEYMLASYHFKYFAKNFSRSKNAEEALFLSAYCKYLDSPKHSLDQSSTYEAINELQLFVNKYPESEKVEESNNLIDELRGKIEKKNFEIAKLYYNTEDYKAAIYAFENFLKEFPGTSFKEETMYLIMKSNFIYASKSIESKKQERFKNTLSAVDNFVSYYPESKHLKEAEQIKRRAKELLEIN
jgi:outer membrane protein assembly factor BamD